MKICRTLLPCVFSIGIFGVFLFIIVASTDIAATAAHAKPVAGDNYAMDHSHMVAMNVRQLEAPCSCKDGTFVLQPSGAIRVQGVDMALNLKNCQGHNLSTHWKQAMENGLKEVVMITDVSLSLDMQNCQYNLKAETANFSNDGIHLAGHVSIEGPMPVDNCESVIIQFEDNQAVLKIARDKKLSTMEIAGL